MTNKLPVVGKRYRAKSSGKTYILEKIYDDYARSMVLDCIDKEYKDGIGLPVLRNFWDFYEELPEDKAENHWQDISSAPKNRIILLKTCDEIVKGEWRSGLNGWFTLYDGGNNKQIEPIMWKEIETKPEIRKNRICELSPEVEEAMESMQFQIDHHYKDYVTEVDPRFLPPILLKVLERAKNLLNALDKQFNLNGYFEGLPPSKEAIERSKAQAEESIWKPVSELPKESCSVFVKHLDSDISFAEFDGNRRGPFLSNHAPFVQKNIASYCRITDLINDYEKLKETVRKLKNDR